MFLSNRLLVKQDSVRSLRRITRSTNTPQRYVSLPAYVVIYYSFIYVVSLKSLLRVFIIISFFLLLHDSQENK